MIAHFFATVHLYLIQGFSDSFLILTFIKQYNLVVLCYDSVLSPLRQSLTQDDLRAQCTVFFNNSNLF